MSFLVTSSHFKVPFFVWANILANKGTDLLAKDVKIDHAHFYAMSDHKTP